MLRRRVKTYKRKLPRSQFSRLGEFALSVLLFVAWCCEVHAMRRSQEDARVVWARCVDGRRRGASERWALGNSWRRTRLDKRTLLTRDANVLPCGRALHRSLHYSLHSRVFISETFMYPLMVLLISIFTSRTPFFQATKRGFCTSIDLFGRSLLSLKCYRPAQGSETMTNSLSISFITACSVLMLPIKRQCYATLHNTT